MRVAQIVSPRCRRVGEGAALGRGIEMRAVLACEAEREASYLVRESIVDEGPHGRRRSRATTVSTWLVCGNISNVAIEVGAYDASRVARSRPSVCASHET